MENKIGKLGKLDESTQKFLDTPEGKEYFRVDEEENVRDAEGDITTEEDVEQVCTHFSQVSKYDDLYEWAAHADISNFRKTTGGMLQDAGKIFVEETNLLRDQEIIDIAIREGEDRDGYLIPKGYIEVNWGEEGISYVPEDSYDVVLYIRWEWTGQEYQTDGSLHESEEKALNGWKIRNDDTPTITEVRKLKNVELEDFVRDSNDIGEDDDGYIFDDNGGYFESMDTLFEEMEYRHGSDGK